MLAGESFQLTALVAVWLCDVAPASWPSVRGDGIGGEREGAHPGRGSRGPRLLSGTSRVGSVFIAVILFKCKNQPRVKNSKVSPDSRGVNKQISVNNYKK